MPWGGLQDLLGSMSADNLALIGCLSFERRCTVVPCLLNASKLLHHAELILIDGPSDAYPDFRGERERSVNSNRKTLTEAGVSFTPIQASLLDSEDRLMDHLDGFLGRAGTNVIVLDVTSFPKRFFCFFIRQLLTMKDVGAVVATYTDAGMSGYTERLAHSPMRPDYLPGFPFNINETNETLVVSVGYEPLGMRSIIETYAEQANPRFLLSFSNDPRATIRQWNTLRYMRPHRAIDSLRQNAEVVAAWDAERVYSVVQRWSQDSTGLVLAPFGPKPHTIGLALFALESDSPMIYTQPKSYDPQYTRGHGETWAYVLKWDGLCCYERDPVPV